jgi:hypothetical protein
MLRMPLVKHLAYRKCLLSENLKKKYANIKINFS